MNKQEALKEIESAKLENRYADLCYADLCSADLCSANLRYADLRYANLCYADLCYANLCYADLPSPTMVLLANWGDLSDELTLEGMRYDAHNHPDPYAFDRWADGGVCPFLPCWPGRDGNGFFC